MLTPMDIQQKRFHVGIGFDKKDVTTFFESVVESYEKLYRSNAELRERVTTLEDTLLNYRSKEESLEKSIMLAEKDSEDKKSKASKEAKSIELDAKNRAKIIIGDAEDRLKEIESEMEMLKTQYAAYKSSLASLLKMHLTHLKEEDFDADSFIDPKYAGVFMGGGARPAGGGASFEYDGDPQMRDMSTLGGAGGYTGMSMDADAKATSSEVYTSLMKDNENFVDPFNTDAQDNGRYNPYDGRTEKPKEKKPGQSTFTVANGNKSRNKAKVNSVASKESAKSTEKAQSPSLKEADKKPAKKPAKKPVGDSAEKSAEEIVNDILRQVTGDTEKIKTPAEPAEEIKAEDKAAETKAEEKAAETKAEEKAAETKAEEKAAETKAEEKAAETKTEDKAAETKAEEPRENGYAREKAKEFFKKAADTLTGEVEEKNDGVAMIGDGSDDGDGDGEFEFF